MRVHLFRRWGFEQAMHTTIFSCNIFPCTKVSRIPNASVICPVLCFSEVTGMYVNRSKQRVFVFPCLVSFYNRRVFLVWWFCRIINEIRFQILSEGMRRTFPFFQQTDASVVLDRFYRHRVGKHFRL